MTALDTLLARIDAREAHVAVIGLGYVGLPLAVAVGEAGFRVTGIDLSRPKVESLLAGRSYIQDVPTESVAALRSAQRLSATTDFAVLSEADAVIICVPTPLSKTKDPDISYIMDAAREIQERLHDGQLIILESTTYPGTTDELLRPAFEEGGRAVGEDFFLCFSPERVDPGNERYQLVNTPKVLGGTTPACLRAGQALYGAVLDTVVPVSSTRAAEMTKLLENTFRAVNIGLVNEVAIMCHKLGIDTQEVIRAASSKPFGFMPFYPGPGLGGHCIPVDPHYLSWVLKTLNYNARFIQLAGEVNSEMPRYVVELVTDALNSQRKAVNGARILLLGVAYKPDVDDTRESPALDVLTLLQARGADVDYADPFIPELRGTPSARSVPLTPTEIATYDCVVITTHHSSFDYDLILRASQLLVDTRGATWGRTFDAARVFRL